MSMGKCQRISLLNIMRPRPTIAQERFAGAFDKTYCLVQNQGTDTGKGGAGGTASCWGRGGDPRKLPFLDAGYIRRYEQCRKLTRLKSWMRYMNVTIQRFQSISSI